MMSNRPNINIVNEGASSSGSAGPSIGIATNTTNDQAAARCIGPPTKMKVALNGISSTVEDINEDFMCPLCFDIIAEAHITQCGHTFCYKCITKAIKTNKRCPKCSSSVSSIESIIPNYLLENLISKYKMKLNMLGSVSGGSCGFAGTGSTGNELKQFLTSESQKLTLPDLNAMLHILSQQKQLLEAETSSAQNRLLYEFLTHLLKQKEQQQSQIAKEIDLISADMIEVEALLNNIDDTGESGMTVDPPEPIVKSPYTTTTRQSSLSCDVGFNSINSTDPSASCYVSRKRRMHAHFDDFVKSYFSVRCRDIFSIDDADTAAGPSGLSADVQQTDDMKSEPTTAIKSSIKLTDNGGGGGSIRKGLDIFRDNLVNFSRYSTLRPLATMHYSTELQNNSTIVSTIVFDKDNEYFAIGGVTMRIKVFDYLAVIRDTIDIHYPVVEMVSTSKISCIAWNSYHKNILAASDYEGAVNIWDLQTGIRTERLHEHEKRCWSVDFNDVDTRLIASGSDDARVKLWTYNQAHSIATLEAKANVCCVKFNPKSSCHLAFGSADHDVHYYDLRNLRRALCVFKGHKKAVSYVKFLNMNEIISASTDSQLKLWNVNSPPYSLRTFVGHVNEKNFVGLAVDGDYMACGSEDNSLYVYYKGLSKQLFSYKIDEDHCRISDPSTETNEFVSAVCWRKHGNVLLAANSRGLIKVLELV